MKKRFAVIAMLSAVIAGLIAPIQATAQQTGREERITLSPAIYRPEFDAGQTGTSQLTVINDGQTEYEVVLYARPFSVTNEDYDPDYTEVNERTQAYQWVQFETTRLRLKAGERTEVPYTINVPQNAASGGHYAVLFAETQPAQDGSNVARKKRVGSLLYMTVKGDTVEQGSIESWQTKFLQTKPPLESTLKIKNSGNVHFQANVKTQYANIFGSKQFELNRELIVLPGTTRKVVVSWENTPYLGIFKASGTVEYLGKTEALNSQWVILMPPTAMITLGVLIVTMLLYVILKRRKSRKKGNAHEKVSKKKQ